MITPAVELPAVVTVRPMKPSDYIDALPESEWTTGTYIDEDGRVCALGCLYRVYGADLTLYQRLAAARLAALSEPNSIEVAELHIAAEKAWEDELYRIKDRLKSAGVDYLDLIGVHIIDINDREGKAAVVAALRAEGY